MGLKDTHGGVTYLSVQGNKIAKRVQEPTAKSKARTIESSGKVIHEELYDSLEGRITAISTREGNFGKELLIAISDGDETFQLQLKLSSSPASSFLKALPNIDLPKVVTFIPKMQIVNDIRRTSIVLSQANKGIKHAFTKDNPGDLPPMKKIKVKGKDTWDDSEQLEFFDKMISEFAEKLRHTGSMDISAEISVDIDNDMPF